MGVRRTRRFSLALAAACLLVCLMPVRAPASATMQSLVMDDDQLIYASPDHVAAMLTQIRSLGVDQVKVSLVWSIVSPDAHAATEPSFDANDPSAYPAHAWDRYDLIVRLAHQLGLDVYFDLTPPAPTWAVAATKPTQGYGWSQRPNATDYKQFVQAAGRRYDGTFVTTVPKTQPVIQVPLGLGTILFPGSQPTAGTPSPLPRVSTWGIWNEPNEGAWLNPQHRHGPHRSQIPTGPALYRGLIDAGYAGLSASGHAGDTILIGETASIGTTLPIPFVRAMYCVGRSDLPLRGRAAAALACPASGSSASFVGAHPGLFMSSGYAHHPYAFDRAPSRSAATPGQIALGALPSLERTLDRIFTAYGRPTGFPLYLTEFGYKTNPPNPFVHTSLDQQAVWLNQGEYMAWQDPRIRSLAQFLLLDDTPNSNYAPGTLPYWGTFQTGLEFADGSHKPSYGAFQIPIWLPSARIGPDVIVWGQLRPANHAAAQSCELQFAPGTSSTWTTLRTIQTASSEGFVLAHVALSKPGQVRLAWTDTTTLRVDYSRAVAVR
ncbi:MAG: hypothetical protein ACYDHH_09065 [Solirubrobacteraceae bacterium]